VPLLAGPAFIPAVPIFRVAGLAVFGMSLGSVMTPQWVARGYFLRNTVLAMCVGGLSVAGNYLFIPRYGMRSCAWVMMASYTIHFIANIVFALWIERRTRVDPVLKPLRPQ
jgi:O-antigen/teichoic acid export membrane protein